MTKPLEGLLWFDNNPKKDWRDKVREAAQRFRERCQAQADVCHVHAATVQAGETAASADILVESVDGIEVYLRPDILRHHFFVASRAHQAANPPRPALPSSPDNPAATAHQPALFTFL